MLRRHFSRPFIHSRAIGQPGLGGKSSIDSWLLRSAGALLLVVGTLKVMSAFSGVPYLNTNDPVFPFITNKLMLLFAANAEFACGALLVVQPNTPPARYGLLALCTTFVFYRVGLLSLAGHPPCPCLGRASDWLGITPRQADRLALAMLLLLLAIAVRSILSCRTDPDAVVVPQESGL
ncbi:MAG: hypothetical protein U1G07_23655 [Verrucomicrobiota bacterium]